MKLIYNAIFGGKWYTAGEAIPNDIVPPALRKYEATEEEQTDDEPKEINLARKYGQTYSVDSAGRMGRPVRRQVAEMQAANAEQEWAEEQASAELDQSVKDALAQAQEQYKASVDQQIANAKIAAERSD